MNMRKSAFTLQEVLIVLIIVGILAALSIPNYTKMKDAALDEVAKSTLGLIRAGEQSYRMDYGRYVNAYAGPGTNMLNDKLMLTIPTGADSKWEYIVNEDLSGGFLGKARRIDQPEEDRETWCIRQNTDEAYSNSDCVWD